MSEAQPDANNPSPRELHMNQQLVILGDTESQVGYGPR
jgi:hypothetical protein